MSGMLVLYFSVYGTAERVAMEIARQTGAEFQRIEPTVPYDSDRNHYDALSRRAFMECERDLRPAIKIRCLSRLMTSSFWAILYGGTLFR